MNTPISPLTLLIALGIIIVLALVFQNRNKAQNIEGENNLKEESNAPVLMKGEPNPAPTPVSYEKTYTGGITPALVAAITASVCMMTGKSAEEFKFKAIKRVPGNQPVWGLVGTTDIISTRQRFIERGNR